MRAVGSRVVFLDFDGVLNHIAFYRGELAEERKRAAATGETPPPPFDPACITRLHDMLISSGASVVVSSSWRIESSVARLSALLAKKRGFAGSIVGMTPELDDDRGHEIRAWLAALPAPPAAWVVIDDEDVAGVDGHFVQTSFEDGGLTDVKVDEALRVLGATRATACPCQGPADDPGPMHLSTCPWSDPEHPGTERCPF